MKYVNEKMSLVLFIFYAVYSQKFLIKGVAYATRWMKIIKRNAVENSSLLGEIAATFQDGGSDKKHSHSPSCCATRWVSA